MVSSVFTLDGVSFSYGKKRIFDGLDLKLREGVVTTLIGANGSGKSTLFDLMTGNLKPQAGRVFLRGGDVGAMRLRDFAKLVAVVHQRNFAPPDVTVEGLVGYGRFPHRAMARAASTEEDDRMVAWALGICGLADLAKAPVASLSGGQCQRAWIATALAQGTDVLLLDEPTTYLDVRYQLEVLRLVRDLNEKLGMTVVMVLHDVNQAIHYSQDIVALRDGRIVAQGDARSVVSPGLLRDVYGVKLDVEQVGGRPFVLAV